MDCTCFNDFLSLYLLLHADGGRLSHFNDVVFHSDESLYFVFEVSTNNAGVDSDSSMQVLAESSLPPSMSTHSTCPMVTSTSS